MVLVASVGLENANRMGKMIQQSASEMTSDSCPGRVEAEKYCAKTAHSNAAAALVVVRLVYFIVLVET